MKSNKPPKKRSLFSKIIGILASFLGPPPKKKPKAEQEHQGATTKPNKHVAQSTSSTSASPIQASTPPTPTKEQLSNKEVVSNESTHAEELIPKVNQATFKYGQQTITLSKSKQYLAIKKKAELENSLAGGVMPRQAAPPSTTESQLGDFELVQPIQPSLDNVEHTLDNLRNLPSTEIGTHVFHYKNQPDNTPLIPSGELYLLFKETSSLSDIRKTLDELHLQVLEERTQREMVVKVSAQSPNPIKCTIRLQESAFIEVAEPDLISRIELAALQLPQDALFKDQWHLNNTGAHDVWTDTLFKPGADAKVVEAWQFMGGYGSKDLIVAVSDNGFDLEHPDLKGDGTKIVYPWDFQTDTDDASPRAGDWHGTPCAAIAVAAVNGEGTVGVAPNSKLMPLRTYYISDRQIEKWFDYVREKGAAIMSNSWGAPSAGFILSTRMIRAMSRCATEGRDGKGVVICFAAGNHQRSISDATDSDKIMGFATHPHVITVSGSTSKDEFASYSNYGKQISVCAPTNGDGGAGVTTADVTGNMSLLSGDRAFRGYEDGDYTNTFGGTSSACPVVAGICALVLSVNPALTAAQVKKIIQSTSDQIGEQGDYDANGHSIYFGYGRVNALAAVKKAKEWKENGVDETEDDTNSDQHTEPPVIGLPPLEPMPTTQRLSFMAIENNQFSGGVQAHYYRISLNRQLVVKLDGVDTEEHSDFDVYLRKKEVPTTEDFDYKSTDWGTKETIMVRQPAQEDFYVLVNAHKGNGGYNMEAMLTPPSSITETPLILRAQGSGILIQGQHAKAVYKLSRHRQLRIELSGNAQQNVDLYVKRAGRPEWDDFDQRSASANANEQIIIDRPDAGDYYILVQAKGGSGNYQLKVIAE